MKLLSVGRRCVISGVSLATIARTHNYELVRREHLVLSQSAACSIIIVQFLPLSQLVSLLQ